MGESTMVSKIVGMAIALSILPIVGCRSFSPSKESSSESSAPSQLPSHESEAPEVDDAPIDAPVSSTSEPITPSEQALPTLPTTPIESLPKINAPQPIPLNADVNLATDKDAVNLLTKGTFVSGEQITQGSLIIFDDEGTPVIELSHDFQTFSNPDLVIVLHQARDPMTDTQPPTYRLIEKDYVEIAPLKSDQGQQRYSIPAAIILDNYNSLAIWCRKSNTTFGAASFQWDE